jgi:hypothetical protein
MPNPSEAPRRPWAPGRFSFRGCLLATLVSAVALLVLPATGFAATFTVNTTADNPPTAGECSGAPADCSLRQAIDASNKTSTDDTITLPAGTYHLTIPGANETNDATGDLDVNKTAGTMTITGAGARTTTIDASGLGDRALQLVVGTLTLSGVTVTGGSAPSGQQGGGIANSGGTLTVSNSTIKGNTATSGADDGGGIASPGGNVTTLQSDTITGNTAGEYGGGVDLDSGKATIVNTTITGNTATSDGGGVDTDSSSAIQFTNDTIDANHSGGHGGGVWVTGSNLAFVNTIVADNTASVSGTSAKATTSTRAAPASPRRHRMATSTTTRSSGRSRTTEGRLTRWRCWMEVRPSTPAATRRARRPTSAASRVLSRRAARVISALTRRLHPLPRPKRRRT